MKIGGLAWGVCVSIWAGSSLSLYAIQPEHLRKHLIDGQFKGGYQVSVADVDTDGKPDVIALSTLPSQLVWYKNPSWERHDITTKTQGNIDLAPNDIDQDGDQDIALAYDFNLQNSTGGGTVAWLECPKDPAKDEWKIHPVGAVPTSHRLRWAQLGEDAKSKSLLNLPIVGQGAKSPDYAGGLSFLAYQPVSLAQVAGPWRAIVIDSQLEMAHGMRVIQWDDDAPQEIFTASFNGVDLFDIDVNSSKFSKMHIGEGHAGKRPKQGSSEVDLGTLRSQESRFVAAIEPWHGNEVVVYEAEDPKKTPWTRTVIDSSLVDGHALACVDIDEDGNDEIVAGCRGGDKALRIYQFAAGSAEWERTLVDAGNIGAAGVFIADINQDGHKDIVAVGTATSNVVWYENVFAK